MAGVAVLVYDGDCGFCTSSARWLQRRAPRLAVVPWQGADLAALRLTERQCGSAVQHVMAGRTTSGGAAIAAALRECGQPYRALGALLGARALQPAVERAYRLVAENRHRLPGSTCDVSGRDERPGEGPLGQRAGHAVPPAHG